MLSIENTGLLVSYLNVCNDALAAHRRAFPYRQIAAMSEKLIGGRNIAAEIYSGDSGSPLGEVTIRYHGGRFEPVADGAHDPVFRVKLEREYMEEVVRHSEEYIARPEKLDWEWLKSRLGIGGAAADGARVKDVMSAGVESIDESASLHEAARKMRDLDIGGLPVTSGSTVLGFVTDRDIAIRGVASGMDPATARVRKVMTPGVISCRSDARVTDAARAMEDLQVRRLLVIGANDQPVGMISLGDLAVRGPDDRMLGRVMGSVSRPIAERGAHTAAPARRAG